MEHKVGEIVTLRDGRKAKVVEYNGEKPCFKCIFAKCTCQYGCSSRIRTDRKDVIYQEIKED